ncbi:hypothetical protein LV75_004156 [Actinokineospora diospyrosa]|uniref:Uncharacterized protein n=1 Tax=Actinokineospora diospyrosa TaxID=103728 RepID=A0ABT1IG67_9PSEU|nr:hypothetical protein [Actinokineospora diospyrosa]
MPSARWGGPVLCGGTAAVASFSGRACFWAPALRFCHGCRRGPAQNRSTASSKARKSRIGPEVAARQRGVRCGSPSSPPGDEADPRSHRIPCPATPTPAYAKINLIESPQIHSLPTHADTAGAATNALWTLRSVVDNPSTTTTPARSSATSAPDIQPTEEARQIGSSDRSLWTAPALVGSSEDNSAHPSSTTRTTRVRPAPQGQQPLGLTSRPPSRPPPREQLPRKQPPSTTTPLTTTHANNHRQPHPPTISPPLRTATTPTRQATSNPQQMANGKCATPRQPIDTPCPHFPEPVNPPPPSESRPPRMHPTKV